MTAARSKQVHDRAEAQFKKAAQAKEGRAAAHEYQLDALAVREKTARLRRLRLAKEAADTEAGAAAAPASKSIAARKRR